MAGMSDSEFERQAVLYAMGALRPEQARRFEAERARRGTQAEKLERGVRQAIDRVGGGARWAPPSEREALATVIGAAPQERSPWGWIATAIVLAVACASAVAWALAERSRAEAQGALTRERAAAADSLDKALAETEAEVARRPRPGELAPLFAAADLVVVPLAGPGPAEGRLLSAPGQGAILVASGLTPLGEPAAYQLWRRTGEVTEPVARLGAAPQGFLFSLLSDTGFLEGAEAILVTSEATPGALAPTEPALLEGRPPR